MATLTVQVTKATASRILRIMEIRKCSEEEAISFAVVCGWVAAEKVSAEKTISTEGK